MVDKVYWLKPIVVYTPTLSVVRVFVACSWLVLV